MNRTKQLWISWQYLDDRPGLRVELDVSLFLEELSSLTGDQRTAVLAGIATIWAAE